MCDTAWMREAADGIADNLGGIIHDGKDVSCELRKAADELDRLQSFIDDAFAMHSNLDLDVENVRNNREPKT